MFLFQMQSRHSSHEKQEFMKRLTLFNVFPLSRAAAQCVFGLAVVRGVGEDERRGDEGGARGESPL